MTGEIILRHFVELNCKRALLMRCVILMKNTAACSLIDMLDSYLVALSSLSLITGFTSGIEFLKHRAELILIHLVLKRFCCDDLYTLFSTFNVRHNDPPITKYFIGTAKRLRGTA